MRLKREEGEGTQAPLRQSFSVRYAPQISAFVVSLVCAYIYWFGNGTLYLSHWNAQLAATLRETQFSYGSKTLGVFWSPLEGLGQRTVESPTWLNLHYSHMILTGGKFSEILFGLTIGGLIYLTTYFMARRMSLTIWWAVLTGVATTFLLFLPSPFLWQRQAGQSSVLFVLPIATALTIGLLFDARLSRRLRLVNSVVFGVSVLLFTHSFGPQSPLYLLSAIAVGLPIVVSQAIAGGSELRWVFYKAVIFAAAVTPQIVSQYSFIALHRQSEQLAPTNTSFGAALAGFWGDLGAVFPWYKWVVFAFLAGVFITGWTMKLSRHLALLGTLSISFPFLGSLLNVIAIQRGFGEVLPSSNYFLIALIPLVLTCVFGILPNIIRRLNAGYQVNLKPLPTTIKFAARFSTLLVPSLLVVWAVVWSVDNRHLRTTPVSLSRERAKTDSLVAPISADLNCTMQSIAGESTEQQFCGRVLLIDSETQAESATSRRDPLWVAAVYAALAIHGVPTVNSYGARYSGPFYQFSNRALTDGSQSIRAWTIYNRLNLDFASLFGVRVVIADRPLDDLKLVRVFDVVDDNGDENRLYHYRLEDSNFNGMPISLIAKAESFSEIIRGLDSQSGALKTAFDIDGSLMSRNTLMRPTRFAITMTISSLHIRGKTVGESVVLLPFEYSNCLQLDSKDANAATLLRLNGIQLAIRFTGLLDAQIRLVDRGFGLRSCWQADQLPAGVFD